MQPIKQSQAVADQLPRGDRSRFFAARRLEEIECLSATFVTHRFAPHSHEAYAIGAIEHGVELFRVRGVSRSLSAGEIVTINPLEVHDGAPADGGFTYRMVYPSIELMELIAQSVTGRRNGAPHFHQPIIRDPEGAALFLAAHRAIEDGHDLLLGEELMLRALGRMVLLGAGARAHEATMRGRGIEPVKQLLDDACEEDYSLQHLARIAGTGPHQLIRSFRKETGLTPHAYVINRRIERAKSILRRGGSPGDVALAVGFCDQAHLTRAFKARLGTTPAACRSAFAA